MTQTLEQIEKTYKKANKEYKAKILKRFGASSFDRVKQLLSKKVDTKEVKMSKTELASFILNTTGTEMEISFQKQIKVDDVYNSIMNSYHSSTPTTFSLNLKKRLLEVMNGVERIAKGLHNNKLDKFGRLYFTETTIERDLTRASDNRTILVNLSTINWAKINGITYTKKD